MDAIHAKSEVLIGELPSTYNCLCYYGIDPNALILHWHGTYGKYKISHQIQKKSLFI